MKTYPPGITIISGPSGVGKGTVVKRLLMLHPSLRLSVSWTTRAPRPGETNQDYIFVTTNQFEAAIANGHLLEWNHYSGHYYGTPAPQDASALTDSCLILEIDVNGARQVKSKAPQARWVLIAPPGHNLEAQVAMVRNRLRGRGTDDDERIERRIRNTPIELQAADEADLVVVNDDLEMVVADLSRRLFGHLAA